ncbi:MAG: hypothetical protein Q4F75_04470 [Pseudomonadota bacterium]|nr:hypothetical protein [Pseudomonadota bacterium]
MEKEKIFQQAKELLDGANLTVTEFVQYCTEKKVKEVVDSAKEFPFEVMYEGLVRSWVPLEGKKPLGVIFENHLITLKSSPETMNWYNAMKYCQGVEVGGRFCNAGEIGFWKKLVNLSEQQKKMLDDLLIYLGGTGLKGKWYWSSSEDDDYYALIFCTDSGVNFGGVNYNLKKYGSSSLVVRPVLDLSDLSY